MYDALVHAANLAIDPPSHYSPSLFADSDEEELEEPGPTADPLLAFVTQKPPTADADSEQRGVLGRGSDDSDYADLDPRLDFAFGADPDLDDLPLGA